MFSSPRSNWRCNTDHSSLTNRLAATSSRIRQEFTTSMHLSTSRNGTWRGNNGVSLVFMRLIPAAPVQLRQQPGLGSRTIESHISRLGAFGPLPSAPYWRRWRGYGPRGSIQRDLPDAVLPARRPLLLRPPGSALQRRFLLALRTQADCSAGDAVPAWLHRPPGLDSERRFATRLATSRDGHRRGQPRAHIQCGLHAEWSDGAGAQQCSPVVSRCALCPLPCRCLQSSAATCKRRDRYCLSEESQ